MALQTQLAQSSPRSPGNQWLPVRSLLLLDGSHEFVAAHTSVYREQMTITDMAQAETVALCSFMERFSSNENFQAVSALG